MIDLPKLTLVLGGAASGKSKYAETLCLQCGLPRTYIATSRVWDSETKAKVAQHRTQRGPDWTTIEEPIDLPTRLRDLTKNTVVLLDCATLWLTNILLAELDIEQHTADLRAALMQTQARVVVVSNEVGYGIVPENALSRRFRNAQGTLNQELAQDAASVVAVMAGLPLALKGQLP